MKWESPGDAKKKNHFLLGRREVLQEKISRLSTLLWKGITGADTSIAVESLEEPEIKQEV